MTPADTLRLLTLAAAYDPTVLPSDPDDRRTRAEAWSLALNPAITYPDAQSAIVDHYAHHTDSITVADLNGNTTRRTPLPPGYYTQAELTDGAGIKHDDAGPQHAAPHASDEPVPCCGRRRIHTHTCPTAPDQVVP